MITVQQILAENNEALSNEQELALTMLVRSYGEYTVNQGRWPGFVVRLSNEKTNPTVKTKALKAVLTALNKLPKIVVESEGTEKSPGYFSTKKNWDELALDVLNILFDVPFVPYNASSMRVMQRKIVLNNLDCFLVRD